MFQLLLIFRFCTLLMLRVPWSCTRFFFVSFRFPRSVFCVLHQFFFSNVNHRLYGFHRFLSRALTGIGPRRFGAPWRHDCHRPKTSWAAFPLPRLSSDFTYPHSRHFCRLPPIPARLAFLPLWFCLGCDSPNISSVFIVPFPELHFLGWPSPIIDFLTFPPPLPLPVSC